MRVLLSTYGSRGDVQPLVGLALALQSRDVDAPISTPADDEFAQLLNGTGVALRPACMPVQQWIETARQRGETLPQIAARMVPAQFDAIAKAAQDCDAIVATGLFPSIAAAQMVAEMRGVPFIWTAFCPIVLPSPYHPPMPYPGWPHPEGMTDNLALWDHNAAAMDALFGAAVNTHRAAIGLPTVEHVRDYVFTDQPWLACDAVLSPWRAIDTLDAVQTGAWIMPDARPLPAEVETFLSLAEPPVYVGFGSMTMHAAPEAAKAAIEAARSHGRRVLLARGWAKFAAIDDYDDCLVIGEINQQALFPRVAAVVHHGGAGTTTAAAIAGAPQVIVPQIADQPYWANRVAELGIGVAHDGPVPTAESLQAALANALTLETRGRAAAIAGAMRTDGATVAAQKLIARLKRAGPGGDS